MNNPTPLEALEMAVIGLDEEHTHATGQWFSAYCCPAACRNDLRAEQRARLPEAAQAYAHAALVEFAWDLKSKAEWSVREDGEDYLTVAVEDIDAVLAELTRKETE